MECKLDVSIHRHEDQEHRLFKGTLLESLLYGLCAAVAFQFDGI
jgi:hypothetical protein